MKTTLFFLLVSVLLGTVQCKRSSAEENSLDQTLELQKEQTIKIPNAGGAQLTLANLNDSRCPTNARCVWAGNATATLQLTSRVDSAQTVSLCLGQCQTAWHLRDSAAVTLNRQPYWLYLTAVNPYPGTGSSPQKKVAVVRVAPR